MTDKIKKINNPLTIIAIFAALAEINATIALGLIEPELQHIFIWFVIGFPLLLVILFFTTLNFNTKVMYSPSDFQEDKNFLDSLFGKKDFFKNEETDFNIRIAEESLNKIESKLMNQINQRFQEVESNLPNNKTKELIEELKADLSKIASESVRETATEFKLSNELREKLHNKIKFPAFYVLIQAIIESNSQNIESLSNVSNYYSLPDKWDSHGIEGLLEENILIGDLYSFELNPTYKEQLVKWIHKNKFNLRLLRNSLRQFEESEDGTTKQRAQNRIEKMIERLKF
jgi:hypothetical protein